MDWNATQAAMRAGYRAKRAEQAGYQLLRKAEVQAAIAARQQALQQQCAGTQERVIQELAAIGFSDLRHYCTWGPDGVRLEPSGTLTPAHSQVIKQVQVQVGADGRRTVRVQLHDKIAALDKLARHLGLYTSHDPEEEWGKGLLGLKQAVEAREYLKTELDKLAQKARANGQGEADRGEGSL